MAKKIVQIVQIDSLPKDCLVIEHINAQSLISNLDEVKLLILDRDTDVLCISETWLLPHTLNTFINLPNYTVHSSDKGRGAGVCIYAKQCLNAVMIDV